MIEILLLMAAGIFTGYLLRQNKHFARHIERLIIISIFLLLFFMGLSIGRDPLIISQLPLLGITAVLISVGGILGSMIFALVVWKYFFVKKPDSHADES